MEDYVIQRTNIFGNLLKISAVFLFFENTVFDVVGYFLYTQIVNFLASLVTFFIIVKRYDYGLKELLSNFKFDYNTFHETRGLAFSSFFLSISWVLYYELDSVTIGNLLGAHWVAIYAIGLTVLSFFRSILGIIYSPINVRFNHFVGLRDEEGLRSFVLNIIVTLAPVVTIPIFTIMCLAKPIVLSWVGIDYLLSVEIMQLLVFCNFFAFISYPVGNLLVAQERHRQMYFMAVIVPVIFWCGVAFSMNLIGVKSFAIFKMISFLFSFFVYFYYLKEYLGMSWRKLLLMIFKPLALPIAFVFVASEFIIDYLPTYKSKLNFITMFIVAISVVLFSFILMYFTSEDWRSRVGYIFSKSRISHRQRID
jgi:O-antigen/teichoic acid export membrane protein